MFHSLEEFSIYVDNELKYFSSACPEHCERKEGRVFNDAGDYRYEYNLTDHLGNVRLSFTDINADGLIDTDPTVGEILQEDHYYPFGLRLGGLSITSPEPNRFRYNGKELNTEGGLNWYDYGLRDYDPSTARWAQIDPLSEDFSSWSPYNYSFNSPILFIDPDGAAPDCCQGEETPNPEGTAQKQATETAGAVGLRTAVIVGTREGQQGIISGAKGRVMNAVSSLAQLSNPTTSAIGAANLVVGISVFIQDPVGTLSSIGDNIKSRADTYMNGTLEESGKVLGETIADVADVALAGKGAGKLARSADAIEDVGGVLKAKEKLHNVIPEGKEANHIFSGKEGKFTDTPGNRRTITDLANNKNNLLGTDEYGKSWYAKTLDNGTQVYAYTQKGKIKGAGINPKPLNIIENKNIKK